MIVKHSILTLKLKQCSEYHKNMEYYADEKYVFKCLNLMLKQM